MQSGTQLLRCSVNGVVFELSEELVQKRAPHSILADEDRRAQFYSVARKAYVFDQPADAFEVLVYFISTGLLSRPMNVSSMQLYSLLVFFEMDETVIKTFKKMEHLAFEIHWEKTSRGSSSWIHTLFALPFAPKPKIVNTFLFAMTMISYGDLCFEYTFALPQLHPLSLATGHTTAMGLDLRASTDNSSLIPEIIYLILLVLEFSFRFIYASDKRDYLFNYLAIIDFLAILSCLFYLYSSIVSITNGMILQLIAGFRFMRILKLARYSTYVRQYVQAMVDHYEIPTLLLFLLISLCGFFGHLTYAISLIDRQRNQSTPLEALYYSFETIFTIGFGIHIPSTPYLTGLTLTSVLLGMICFSLPVPFLAIYSFNLENYEQEKRTRF